MKCIGAEVWQSTFNTKDKIHVPYKVFDKVRQHELTVSLNGNALGKTQWQE